MADYLSTSIWLETGYGDIGSFIEVNSVCKIACHNTLSNKDYWKEFAAAMRNGDNITPYAERLYQKVSELAHYFDKECALEYFRFA